MKYSAPVRRFVRDGAPYLAVMAVLVLACGALLAIAGFKSDRATRAFAQFTATENGCELHGRRSLNALACAKIGEGEYVITFSVPLADSTPVLNRAGEMGGIAARVAGRRAVMVTFSATEIYPATVSVLLP